MNLKLSLVVLSIGLMGEFSTFGMMSAHHVRPFTVQGDIGSLIAGVFTILALGGLVSTRVNVQKWLD